MTKTVETHLVHWDVETYVMNGKEESDWDMIDQVPIDTILAQYIEGCAEHEDSELTEIELKRLNDFVLFMKNNV